MCVARTHQLTTLHTILSTGSPLNPQSFDFVYENIKSDVLLGSVTGGTDIIACFAGNNVMLSVHRGEIQSPHLGCAVQSYSEDGTLEIISCQFTLLASMLSVETNQLSSVRRFITHMFNGQCKGDHPSRFSGTVPLFAVSVPEIFDIKRNSGLSRFSHLVPFLSRFPDFEEIFKMSLVNDRADVMLSNLFPHNYVVIGPTVWNATTCVIQHSASPIEDAFVSALFGALSTLALGTVQ